MTASHPPRPRAFTLVVLALALVVILSSGVAQAASVSLGRSFGCAARADHTVSCWGENAFGQLGDATRTVEATPGPWSDSRMPSM